MKTNFFSLILLFFFLSVSHVTWASEIYDCGSALEKLGRFSTAKSQMSAVDIKKQLAEIIVVRSPILLGKAYLDVGRAAWNAEREQWPSISYKGYLLSSYDPKFAATACLKSIEENTFRGLLGEFGFSYAGFYGMGEASSYKLTSFDTAALSKRAFELGLTTDQLGDIQKILSQILGDKTLFSNFTQLVHESMPYLLKSGKKPIDGQTRLKFFEGVEGKVLVDESVSRDLLEKLPTAISLGSLTGTGDVTLKLTFADGEVSETTSNFIDLLTQEYPVLWNQPFSGALRRGVESSGVSVESLVKKLNKADPKNSYRSSELGSIAKTIWAQLLGAFDIHQGLTLKVIRNKTVVSSEVEGKASALGYDLFKYYQIQSLLFAIQNDPTLNKEILRIIESTLKESAQLTLTDEKLQKSQAFFERRLVGKTGYVADSLFLGASGVAQLAHSPGVGHAMLGLAAAQTALKGGLIGGAKIASKFYGSSLATQRQNLIKLAKSQKSDGGDEE